MKLLSADAIRRCIVAEPGKLIISADFDQIEYRIAAALAGEQSLIDAAKRGESMHKLTASRIFGENYTPDQYRYAKNLGFGWLFGGGAATLSMQTGIPLGDAQKLVNDYQAAYPALVAYKKTQTELILQSAFSHREYKVYRSLRSQMFNYRDTQEGRLAKATVKAEIRRLCWGKIGYAWTPFGRRLVVDAEKAYTAVNYIVQSSARDVMGRALLRVMGDERLEPTVLLPIHDEILGQAPARKAEKIAKLYGEIMTTDFDGIPLTAEGKVYGRSWGDGYTKKD